MIAQQEETCAYCLQEIQKGEYILIVDDCVIHKDCEDNSDVLD